MSENNGQRRELICFIQALLSWKITAKYTARFLELSGQILFHKLSGFFVSSTSVSYANKNGPKKKSKNNIEPDS